MTAPTTPRWPVVAGVLIGSIFGVIGTRSLLGAARDTHPLDAARWIVGLALVHDLVLAPFVLVIGVAVRRLVPAAWRSLVGSGLLVTGVVTLVAWPLVRGYGRLPSNPSIQPRDYGAGLGMTLALVWTVVLALGLRVRRQREP